MFRNNRKRFYEITEENNKEQPTELPNPQKATQFWSNIWSEEVTHNEKAAWLRDIEDTMKHRVQQTNLRITKNDVESRIGNMANRNQLFDKVQGFWFSKH